MMPISELISEGEYTLHLRRVKARHSLGHSILVLHGSPLHSMCYAYLADELSKYGYDVELLDLPLHGLTKVEKPTNEITLNDMIEATNLIIKYIKEGGNEVSVFGHSFGGVVATHCLNSGIGKAVLYGVPENFTQNILVRILKILPIKEIPIRRIIKAVLEEEAWKYFNSVIKNDPSYMANLCIFNYPKSLLESVLKVNTFELLNRSKIPVLYLRGEYDKLTRYTEVSRIVNNNVKIEEIPEEGHVLPLKKDGESLAKLSLIINKFLLE
ncbi:MAG: alpha/beta fold hydrolase [Candidatus Aenigmatarchaeota archaeon]